MTPLRQRGGAVRIGFPVAACLAAAFAAATGSGGAVRRDADQYLRAEASRVDQPGTVVRIALATAASVRVGGEGSFRFIDPDTGEGVWRSSFRGEIAVVADGAPDVPVPEVWRIQTGSYSTETAAREQLRRLQQSLGVEGVVRYHPDRASWRVRIGEAVEREALAGLVSRVRDNGFAEAFLVSEPAREIEGVTLRLVDDRWESFATRKSRIALIPDAGTVVEAEGKPYRGLLELRVSRDGRVRVVNWVEAESYLRGVVPAELGPEVWPQLEALKAQAVAARTYLYANLGQFEEDRYDLCSTPRCQVYGGRRAEHPLSDRAVRTTRGEILTYDGKPISALYTATCGGHTEDVANVFPEQTAPYLRGVPCRDESASKEGGTFRIDGKSPRPVSAETGEDVTRAVSLLSAMGVFDTADPVRLRAPLDGPSLRRLTVALARVTNRPVPEGPVPVVSDLASASRMLIEDLGWHDRAYVVMEVEDVPAILRDREALAVPAADRRALAALVAWADLRPGPDGRYRVREPVSRARLAPVLARIAEGYDADGLREATLRAVEGRRLRLSRGKGELELPLADRPYLFSSSGEVSTQAERLEVWPGDRIRVRTDPEGRVDYLELRGPLKGASDDRSASVHSWTVRRSAGELEAAVSRRLAVGELRDLQVVRRGVSGRIAELRVVGRDGEALVRGFEVRNLFDLRESLTSIELQRDARGRVTGAVFAGRGWGHGVGLCQVGAYGMALRGRDYIEILNHYYHGAALGPVERAPR